MKAVRSEITLNSTKEGDSVLGQIDLTLLSNKVVGKFSDIVELDSLEDLPYYYLILGNQCNPDYCFPDNEYFGLEKLSWSKDIEKISEVFSRVPTIHKKIYDSGLSLKENEGTLDRINQEFVHKSDIRNVVISRPVRFGNMWYFNMFLETNEFKFDHESDHVEGMMLMEAARQTGIATSHLNGLSIDGRLNMSCMNTKFYNYVEFNSPILIRSISNIADFSNGDSDKSYVIVNIIQFGKICATVHLEGVMFKSKSAILDYRERSIRLNQKIKSKYLKIC